MKMKLMLIAVIGLLASAVFASRAENYYLGCESRASNSIPAVVTVSGKQVTVLPGMNAELGILVRVDAIADAGKSIVDSHGVLQNGQWVEVIDVQKTFAELNNAAALAKSKFTKYQIRLAMRSLGIEATLDTLLTNSAFRTDWNDAIEIDLNNAKTKQALESASIDINAVKIAISNLPR